MSSKTLRPWTEVVKLHPDVESGELTEALFALDLGAIAMDDPEAPVVYRDPQAFFCATYLTRDLGRLLDEVLTSLTGKKGYNRVLKLRTPFGGGKSHTLAALLHAARSRSALNAIPEAKDFADPGKVGVAVFDGEKFDASSGKTLEDGRKIRTMWGWLAWQLGEDKFKLVEEHDRDRVSPGGDVIKEVLSGGPKLFLLDEVLKYMERAAAVSVHDSTLRRQALDFFQNLTVEIAGSKEAVLVYSLQWSAREAMENVALLQELDHMAARVDQLREPVTGDEILPVLQRRLLGDAPPEAVAQEVADAYSGVVTSMRRAYADTAGQRQQAEEEGRALRERIRASYPFHPMLIDIMRERWTSLSSFQRTRGALRFLASCMHSLKKSGGARALLGPGDVLLKDVDVRVKMLKELGAQNEFDPVITADIDGPNARARRIDEKMGRETPALTGVKPATRLTTATLLYSFGGLRREGLGDETLPPGVGESELLASCVGPDFDDITAKAVLFELRNSCLYLHYDGLHYCFKKDPNVTKLIEDAEQGVSQEDAQAKGRGPVREKIKEMLDARLAGHHTAIVWPDKSHDIPDEDPRFLLGYLPLEFVDAPEADQERKAKEFLSKYGDRPRRYRNGLGLALPNRKKLETLKRAVRYLIAIERVEGRKQQLRLSKDQLDQLRERKQTESAAAEANFRELYATVWLPRVEGGELGIEKVDRGGRPLQATGIHERIMELLTGVGTPRVHGTVTPRKIAERVRLGESIAEGEPPLLGIRTSEVLEAFYRDISPPRLDLALALRKGIARGIEEGVFAYTSGTVPVLGAEGKFQVSRDKTVMDRPIAHDEVDLESGFLMVHGSVPEPQVAVSPGVPAGGVEASPEKKSETGQVGVGEVGEKFKRSVIMAFTATRDQIFKAFPAIANLADKADDGKVKIRIEGASEEGFDPSWLRNAVEEPLDEADVERTEE